ATHMDRKIVPDSNAVRSDVRDVITATKVDIDAKIGPEIVEQFICYLIGATPRPHNDLGNVMEGAIDAIGLHGNVTATVIGERHDVIILIAGNSQCAMAIPGTAHTVAPSLACNLRCCGGSVVRGIGIRRCAGHACRIAYRRTRIRTWVDIYDERK